MAVPGQLCEVRARSGSTTLTPGTAPALLTTTPYSTVDRIDTAGHIAVTELFDRPSNPDCCPSGRAVTIWKWTGRTFIPGHTKLTIR